MTTEDLWTLWKPQNQMLFYVSCSFCINWVIIPSNDIASDHQRVSHHEALDRGHATMDTKLMIDVKMQPNGTQHKLKSIDGAAAIKRKDCVKTSHNFHAERWPSWYKPGHSLMVGVCHTGVHVTHDMQDVTLISVISDKMIRLLSLCHTMIGTIQTDSD